MTKRFDGSKSGQVLAVDDVNLEVAAGDVIGVVGYSGAGKSTLVRLINALELPTSGHVVVDGDDLTIMNERQLRELRSNIGMVFQQFNLMTSRTVAGNVGYPLKVAGWSRADRNKRVAELLEFVGIADKARQFPSQLSGGQKQRVGIARALATSPKILLADEATSALDPETTGDVLALLKKINTELGTTIVVITHEMDVVRSICNTVGVMSGGKLLESGSVYEVFSNPRSSETKRFIETTLKDKPSPETLARLRHSHPGRIVSVGIREGTGSRTTLSDTLRRFDVHSTMIYGGISEIQQKPFRSLTYELSGNERDVEALVIALRSVTDLQDWGSSGE
ncbi:methionine ABC transporter ATP-binding protein [Spelaeicoccus albus]|uniref:methionine ABC transporter ATP-binding protein n=1 Tax=Spelaeicoccus albus TaxID=1280376 RepID=UPI001F1A6CCF|nr:methionine ABC transporter ATP-binding protein [Spelaeicoccus albus]